MADPACSASKILVIEDNDLNAKLILQLLALDKYVTLAAETAEEGIILALEQKPDMILLDIRLPGMSGVDALKKLREHPELEHTAIVAISAYAMQSDIQSGLDAGFDDYLTKPFDVGKFREKIAGLLNDSPSIRKQPDR